MRVEALLSSATNGEKRDKRQQRHVTIGGNSSKTTLYGCGTR